MTVAFFALLPHIPWQRELLMRYCSAHPIEICSMTLFFIGTGVYIRKLIALSREKKALRETTYALASVSRIEGNESWIDPLVTRYAGTYASDRLRDAVHFHRHSPNGDIREHLKYLAELGLEKLNQSYQFVQTIIWAVPILGFLGTVLGITIAIANVTPEQLESHISEVTGGLGGAFDTTSQALTLSLVLVFCSFLIRQLESKVVEQVEWLGMDRLSNLFQSAEPITIATAETQVAVDLMNQSHELLAFHQKSWGDALMEARSRFEQTLADQSVKLETSLTQAGVETISEQARLMHQFRVETIEQIHRFQTESSMQMQQMTLALKSQVDELKSIAQVYASLHSQHGQLKVLQESLDENLQSIQQADTFQETLETLSAAVQLLGARVRHAA